MDRQPQIGDNLFVEWNSDWYAGEVMALNNDGTVHIHYTGWSEEFDEMVPLTRLSQVRPTAAQRSLPNIAPGPVYWDSLDRFLLGTPVTAGTRLRAGDALHVEWQGSWWAAEVIVTNSDGSVTIHYTGWDKTWDETVSRQRLQLPASGEKLATFHLDRGWSVTGRVLEVLPDSFVFNRVEDHRVCVIRKEQVRYLELHDAPPQYVQGVSKLR